MQPRGQFARVANSLLTRYVLDGGWSMLLLLPASVVTMAVALRCFWLLRDSNLQRIASALHVTENTSRADTAYAAALQLYGSLQPLVAMYVLAPLIGLLGSLTALMPIQAQLSSSSPRHPEAFAAAFHHALIPPFWGLSIACVSYAAFAILRAQIFRAETELFQ